jgi:hypothetical protein
MLVSTTVLLAITLVLLLYCFKTIKEHVLCFISLAKLPGPPLNDIISGNLLPLYANPGKNYYYCHKLSRFLTDQKLFRQDFQDDAGMG